MKLKAAVELDILRCLYYGKIHCLTSEFLVKFHARNRYECDIGFSSEILRGMYFSGSEFFLNRIAKATKLLGETKRATSAPPVRKQWKPFQSQVSRSSE